MRSVSSTVMSHAGKSWLRMTPTETPASTTGVSTTATWKSMSGADGDSGERLNRLSSTDTTEPAVMSACRAGQGTTGGEGEGEAGVGAQCFREKKAEPKGAPTHCYLQGTTGGKPGKQWAVGKLPSE